MKPWGYLALFAQSPFFSMTNVDKESIYPHVSDRFLGIMSLNELWGPRVCRAVTRGRLLVVLVLLN